MSKCLQCGVDIESYTGRRPKKFCSDTCRAKYHLKPRPKTSVLRTTYEEVFNRNKELETKISELLDKNKDEFKKVANDIIEGNIGITHTDTEGNATRVDPLSEQGQIIQRIAKIEDLLKAPPKYLPKSKRTLLENELMELKNK